MTPLCNLCCHREAGSREHLPGVAAANNSAVDVTYLGRARDQSGNVRPVTITEDDGFVVRTLCRQCNSRTGGNYGTAYKDFVQQFSLSGVLDDKLARRWISLVDVQPLRILKQMVSMFIAAQPSPSPDHWLDLKRFVLNRDARLPDGVLRIYLYRNISRYGRVVPFTGLMSLYRRWPQMLMSEITWPPIGIVFATEPHPLLSRMYDATHWAQQYHFRSRMSFAFSVPQLAVTSHWPLGFGTDSQVSEWADRDGVTMLLHTGDDASGLSLPAVTRPAPRTGRPNGR